ncbi:hypothetical protein [Streptomyces sp. NPDC051567]|uniref:hypothetical protein n=1 Tax=Streptomyces sp. NPDC051567 TaxID=3365660 RepID=UPI0037A7B942
MRIQLLAPLLVAALVATTVPLLLATRASAARIPGYLVQEPVWQRCGPEGPAAYECATVKVPLDYRRPEGRMIDLAIARTKSENPAARPGISSSEVVWARTVAEKRRDRAGPALPRSSTRNTARDVATVRVVLGERKIPHPGHAYGTLWPYGTFWHGMTRAWATGTEPAHDRWTRWARWTRWTAERPDRGGTDDVDGRTEDVDRDHDPN